jgi:hypothetical protein
MLNVHGSTVNFLVNFKTFEILCTIYRYFIFWYGVRTHLQELKIKISTAVYLTTQ